VFETLGLIERILHVMKMMKARLLSLGEKGSAKPQINSALKAVVSIIISDPHTHAMGSESQAQRVNKDAC
jgi:hypothetical protein